MSPDVSPAIGLLVRMFPKVSETFVLEEVLGLERLGVALHIYALAAPTDAIAHPAVARVRGAVVQVPALTWRAAAGFLLRHAALLASSPLRYARALRAALQRGRRGADDFVRAGWLAGQLREDGIAHLHAHFISSPSDIAELVSRMSGMPFSISAHAKDIYLSDPTDLRRKLGAARFTVTCTEFNCRTLRAIAPAARVHRMYHGIDATVFHPAHRLPQSTVPLILSVGRLREKKGLDTLIEACLLLKARGLRFECEIVGYGEERARLVALIDAARLADRVRLVGKLTRDEVVKRYARATVYVQPSRVAADGDRDGIPNVLLEAMAMQLPVVATRVSGIPELVEDGRNGLLVEPDDPAALADAIARLVNEPDLRAALSLAGRTTVTARFDNDRNLRLVMQLLESSRAPAQACALA